MKETVKMWKCKLANEIKSYTACKMTPESLSITETLGRNWLLYDDICKRLGDYAEDEEPHEEGDAPVVYRLTEEDIRHWNDNMKNSDGTKGGHWTVEQTDKLAQSVGVYFEHITNHEWNVACNMIYSDYYLALHNAGVDSAELYGNLARAFLFDRDGPGPAKKLCAYYHYIAHPKH